MKAEKVKYTFWGTPEFAEIILKKLIEGGYPPSVLVCNPDRPSGRKKIITPPRTKALVKEMGVDVKILQPENREELLGLREEIFEETEFGIVAAYAQIIPKEVLEDARLGVIGVHPSLLPRFRGPAPIQATILAGDEKTGVTLYMLDEGVDSGPILHSETLTVDNKSYEELLEETASVAGEMLVKIIPRFVGGEIILKPQDESIATYTKKFEKEDGFVDSRELETALSGENAEFARTIELKVRALNPEPGVYTMEGEKRTKLLAAHMEGDRLILDRVQKEGKLPVDL